MELDIHYRQARSGIDDEGWITLAETDMRYTTRIETVSGCPLCGALVFDEEQHTTFHESLARG
jgi:hypothetical protein